MGWDVPLLTGGGKYGKGLCPFAHPHPRKFVGNFMMVSE